MNEELEMLRDYLNSLTEDDIIVEVYRRLAEEYYEDELFEAICFLEPRITSTFSLNMLYSMRHDMALLKDSL